jgi:restriction system protein
MARRSRKSAFDDSVELIARLPWHVCLVLAVVSWFGFHELSQIAFPKPTNIEGLGAAYLPLILRTLGMVMQVIAPAACVFAAVISWRGKHRRTRLLADAESRKAAAPLARLDWREFEQLVAAHFERLGFAVQFTPGGADGGVDVVARKGSEMLLIQCKQWRATRIGVSVVRELFGVMAAHGATGGFVVSIGPFTADAKAFAHGRNIELVDAHTLLRGRSTAEPLAASSTAPPARTSETPACPKCGAPMVRRMAKHGAKQGCAFLGCSTYPRCRATLPAD